MSKRDERSTDDREPLERLLSFRSPPRISPKQGGGATPLDVLDLPQDVRQVINLLMRQGSSTVTQIALSLHIDIDKTRKLLDNLVAGGYVRTVHKGADRIFEPILGQNRRPGLSSGLWQALQEDESKPNGNAP